MNEQQIQAFFADHVHVPDHFGYASGVEITQIEKDFGLGILTVGDSSFNPGGTVHGGALFTLADTVAGGFVLMNGGNCVTSHASFDYFRPACGPAITCRVTPKKMGRGLCIVAVELTDVASKVVAAGTFTFYMLGDEGGNLPKKT